MKEHPPLVPGWTAFDRQGGSSPQPFLSFSIIPFVGVFYARAKHSTGCICLRFPLFEQIT